MVNTILKQKSIELDASLSDLITEDINDSISTLRGSLIRASETLGLGEYYMKSLIKSLFDNLSKEMKDFTEK